MTKHCNSCGTELKDDYLFCLKCGTPIEQEKVEKKCPKCGATIIDDEQLFCIECGTKLDNDDAAVASPEDNQPLAETDTGVEAKELSAPEGSMPPAPPAPAAASPDNDAATNAPVVEENDNPSPSPDTDIAADETPEEDEPAADEYLEYEELIEDTQFPVDLGAVSEEAAEESIGEEYEDDATTVLIETATATLTRLRTGEEYELSLPEVLGKGSQATCHIIGNSAISRRHVSITIDHDAQDIAFLIEDLNATNKTAVDGVEVPRGQTVPLPSKCTITLADEDFIFEAD